MKYNYSMQKKYLVLFVLLILALPINFGLGFYLGHQTSLNKLQNFGPYFLPLEGIVAKVSDGDTLEITSQEKIPLGFNNVSTRSVRLLGIGAPEAGEPNYKEAKTALERLVMGKKVTLEYSTPQNEKFRRLLAWIWFNGKLINREMINTGLAVPFIMEGQTLKYNLFSPN